MCHFINSIYIQNYWYKYQYKASTQAQKTYFNYLIDLISQRLNRFFVISFENEADRTGHKESV